MSNQQKSDENLMGAIAYLLIPAIVFLIIDKRPFVRFHSLQSIALAVCYFILVIVISILSWIPFLGIVLWIVGLVVNIAVLVIAIYCAVKAYGGQRFELPVIGSLVNKWV